MPLLLLKPTKNYMNHPITGNVNKQTYLRTIGQKISELNAYEWKNTSVIT